MVRDVEQTRMDIGDSDFTTFSPKRRITQIRTGIFTVAYRWPRLNTIERPTSDNVRSKKATPTDSLSQTKRSSDRRRVKVADVGSVACSTSHCRNEQTLDLTMQTTDNTICGSQRHCIRPWYSAITRRKWYKVAEVGSVARRSRRCGMDIDARPGHADNG